MQYKSLLPKVHFLSKKFFSFSSSQTNPNMLSLTPSPFFSVSSWTLEDLTIPQFLPQNCDISDNISRETESAEGLLPSPSSYPWNSGESQFSGGVNDDGLDAMTMSKKINHNANERDRRKKVNILISNLRSLLPPEDKKEKLSIPGLVSQVLKYIPKLHKEVDDLECEKEKRLSRISKNKYLHRNTKKQKCTIISSPSSTISVSSLGDKDILIQISEAKGINNNFVTEALEYLEAENNLLLLNASSFKLSGERVLNSLHLQLQDNDKLEPEILRQKLLLLYEKTDKQVE